MSFFTESSTILFFMGLFFTIASGLLVYWERNLRHHMVLLQANSQKHDIEINNLKLHVSEMYVSKSEFMNTVNRMYDKLDSINENIFTLVKNSKV